MAKESAIGRLCCVGHAVYRERGRARLSVLCSKVQVQCKVGSRKSEATKPPPSCWAKFDQAWREDAIDNDFTHLSQGFNNTGWEPSREDFAKSKLNKSCSQGNESMGRWKIWPFRPMAVDIYAKQSTFDCWGRKWLPLLR